LVARKGHRVLLDAMALARSEGGGDEAAQTAAGRLRCFIAGDGPLRRQLAQRIAHHGLACRVTMLGPVTDPSRFLNALDLFVMPSLNEGLGVAALEAAAAGLPVVASAVGGLPEVVDDGRAGVLVKAADPHALADAIVRLAADSDRRAAMGGEARRRALENWSMQSTARRTLTLYYECLDRKHRGAAALSAG
jgi:glycosyltransferase involved in cell wall biosynthesis